MQTIQLGYVVYTKAHAIAILQQSTSGDRTYALASQLIAAKLNTNCEGSDADCVASAISSADAWLCQHPIGSGVTAKSSAWTQITPTYNTLVAYNQGQLCTPKCRS